MLFFSALGAAHSIFTMERESAKVVVFYGCQGRGAEGDSCKYLAGRPGFEPGYTESESVVLPLNDPPAVSIGSSVQSNETSHMERIELRTHRDHDTINRACLKLLSLKTLIINKKISLGHCRKWDKAALAFFRKNPLHQVHFLIC
jgi:hypothetical protein